MAGEQDKLVMFGGMVTLTPSDIRKGKGSLIVAVRRKLNRRTVTVTVAEVIAKQDASKSTNV